MIGKRKWKIPGTGKQIFGMGPGTEASTERALVIGEAMIQNLLTGRTPQSSPLQVARQLQELNISTQFVTRVGDDDDGHIILSHIDQNGLDTFHIQRDRTHPTASIETDNARDGEGYNQPVVPRAAFDFIEFDSFIPFAQSESLLIYFDSLIQRNHASRKRFHQFLEQIPETAICTYDMNLYPECCKRELIIPSLQRADLLILSEDELTVIGELMGAPPGIDYLAQSIMDIFEITQIAITRGTAGSILYTPQGCYSQRPTRFGRSTNIDSGQAAATFAAMISDCFLKQVPPKKSVKRATKRAENYRAPLSP
ncbi:PfkB family carbohydrate kinase [Pontiella agarivorans]|uniref:PfkB family carbohydrate kinase n=1 Tax=Pontiella agarivorans TaxID=3038953 RepID=A0ABU5MTW5_9BACT|nr:PfkB family carbohydrate kinase [Pontiella agarivorans]MDZ8117659.1 PfkB family carbohydrate kinase [Pontiella agarivorans]